MTEERGAVPKTSYAGGKFDPKKNVRGGDRKIRGTDADRKAISRAEMKSRAEKERDDATPSTSKAALDQLAKGQLISKCPFGQKTSSKKRKKYFWISALKFLKLPGSFLWLPVGFLIDSVHRSGLSMSFFLLLHAFRQILI